MSAPLSEQRLAEIAANVSLPDRDALRRMVAAAVGQATDARAVNRVLDLIESVVTGATKESDADHLKAYRVLAEGFNERGREIDRLRAERHTTNEALDDAVKALRERACECFSPEFHQPECSQSQTVVDGVEYSFVHWYTDADGTWLLPVSGDELRMQVEGDAAYEPIPLGELLSEYGPLTRTEFYRELSRDEIRQLQAEAGGPR